MLLSYSFKFDDDSAYTPYEKSLTLQPDIETLLAPLTSMPDVNGGMSVYGPEPVIMSLPQNRSTLLAVMFMQAPVCMGVFMLVARM